MPDITLATMKHVDIRPGWLKLEFIKHVLGMKVPYSVMDATLGVEISKTFRLALNSYDALVVQKNAQYKDAWQKDGPITALVDLKDKLYRLESANEDGAVIAWEKDKLIGTLFDILVRTIMCLAWFGLNFKDDDDDRKLDDPDYSERHA